MNLSRNNSPWLLGLLLLCHAGVALAERADRNKPMHLEANSVSVDDVSHINSFEGNVQMLQGTLSIQADKIVVVQDKDGFQQCTATGQLAHFRQKREAVAEYVEAYGERIEYNTHSEIAEFFGQARIKRAGDDVRGEHIIYNTRTEIFQVSGTPAEQDAGTPSTGRVTVVIQPQNKASAVAPAGPPLPIKPTTTITEPKQ